MTLQEVREREMMKEAAMQKDPTSGCHLDIHLCGKGGTIGCNLELVFSFAANVFFCEVMIFLAVFFFKVIMLLM